MPKISCEFAFIDVKESRHDLKEHFETRPTFGECPPELRIPIILTGYIDGVCSGDDGESQEFTVTVEKVELP